MTDLWPIYMPTRGRAGRVKFPDDQDVTLVVHPGELGAYNEAYPNRAKLALPDDEPGIGRVREWIKNTATQRGQLWYWCIDDDIGPYSRVVENRIRRAPAAKVLTELQDVAQLDQRIAMIAPEFQQVAWRADRPLKVNSHCESVVALHTQRTSGMHYRFTVHENLDMVFQIVTAGLWTVLGQWWAFDTPPDQTLPGGMLDLYLSGAREHATEQMFEQWPHLMRTGTDGRGITRTRIRWKDLAPPKYEQDFAFAGRVPGWR